MPLRIDVNAEPIPGYRLIERIGGGGFGEVWRAEAPGGLAKAIKVIHGDLRSVDADTARHAEQELRALKRLQGIRHPYLLSLERYDVIEGRLLIVSELADCNLWDRFKECRNQGLPGITRSELLRYMEESAEVLDMMNNQHQLQHLDIKPQNLFLMYNHVKVADFGLVKDLEGVRGTITGGVTPVYAAPETFDSVVTRFCDQYSLAIVYQELLTGVRPFNGTSGQQLLMQHLREPPNLGPLPPSDRPIVGRALSKKPEDRFPSCLHFVRALLQNGVDGGSPGGHSAPTVSAARIETPPMAGRSVPPMPGLPSRSFAEPQPPMETPRTEYRARPDESTYGRSSFGGTEYSAPRKVAPPEMTGNGLLFPVVVIGLGQTGLEVVREFRRTVVDRFGAIERIPTLKIIYVDTDSEALHAAGSAGDRSLNAEEIFPARLNRAAHYLKPRRNGRSLIEGWFDAQTLYKIPRNPASVGLRSLGRLAFMDHYRAFAEKLNACIESTAHPDSLAGADRATKLGIRSNRPRVYVVTGTGGGTGSGMFLDAAYTARHKLRQLGYLEPDVVGILVTPPVDKSTKSLALANTYTALRELNHFSRPDTVFTAGYEDRDGGVNDTAPPFVRALVVPSITGKPGAGTSPHEPAVRRAAAALVSETVESIGRVIDEVRPQRSDLANTEFTVQIQGRAAFSWPRQMLTTHCARWLSAEVLQRWIGTDPQVVAQFVRTWLEQRWKMEELGPEHLVVKLEQSSQKFLGQPAEALFTAEAAPYVQKGWFAKEPDPAKLWQTFSRLQQLIGMPDERIMQRTVGQIERHLDESADGLIREFTPKFMRLAITLLEHPDYRLVGAQEVVRQLQQLLEQSLHQYESMSANLTSQSIDAYFRIHNYLNAEKGQKRPPGSEMAEAVRLYPTWRVQALILRQIARVYSHVRTQLTDQLRELQFCGQRLTEIMNGFRRESSDPAPPADRLLLPPGIPSLQSAEETLRQSVSAEDIRNFDKKLQVRIESEFNALFNVCLSSVNMLGSLQHTIEDQAKNFVNGKIGPIDLSRMFFARYPDVSTAGQAIAWLYGQSEPAVRVAEPERNEVFVVGIPSGQSGESFRHVIDRALPEPPSDYSVDENSIMIVREYPAVPLSALPQLGTLAEDAYNAALDSAHGSPHARIDVAHWQDVEVC